MEEHELERLLQRLAGRDPAWLPGDAGVLVHGRLRVSANVRGLAFPDRLTRDEGRELRERLAERLGAPYPLEAVVGRPSESQWEFFTERWLQEPARFADPGAVLRLAEDERAGLLLGGHDHLRFCLRGDGPALVAGADAIEARLAELEQGPGLALDPDSGERLVSSPFLCGSGAHLSLMLHLPGLCWWGRLEETLDPLYDEGLCYRTWQDGFGDFLVAENIGAEGRVDSRESLHELLALVARVEEAEEESRQELLAHRMPELEDRVARAGALCRSARLMGYPELVEHLSLLRLGRQLAARGRLDSELVPVAPVTPLLLRLAPAQLAFGAGGPLDGRASAALRAARLRQALAG